MPMQMSVRITDHGIYQGLRKVGAGIQDWAEDEMWQFMQLVQTKASGGYTGGNTYTEVPERGYVRTGNYGRSFSIVRNGLTFTLKVAAYSKGGNEYGKYVGGDGEGEGQAPVHVGWWPVVRRVLDSMVNTELIQKMNDGLRNLLWEAGIGL